MNLRKLFHSALTIGALVALSATQAVAGTFTVKALISDDPVAVPAQLTDTRLINAWGVSYLPGGPFWVSATGTGVSPVYRVDPTSQTPSILPTYATIPGDGSVTGQVYLKGGGGFNDDFFLFVSEDGTVSGWRTSLGTAAEVLVPANSANVYKGAAGVKFRRNTYLLAANFRSGKIDVIKGKSTSPDLPGKFEDPNLPAGYAPFNVQKLGRMIYVTYAKQDAEKKDEVPGPGLGIVNQFNTKGKLLGRAVTGGKLNAPWGLAIAPSSFGTMAGALLVGNFGDGRITAYDSSTFAELGQVAGSDGQPLSIEGLWALTPGGGGLGGSMSMLYYTAGPVDETHGVFGVLLPNP